MDQVVAQGLEWGEIQEVDLRDFGERINSL